MENRWANRSSAELVEAALRRPEFPKYIGIELGQRSPYEAGARRVCEAYREGKLEDWVAANLLGNLQHRVGYETVLGMLSKVSLSAGSGYVGGALVRLDKVRAHDDLRRLIVSAPTQAGRAEAAWGLASIPSAAGCLAVAGAASEGLIGRKLAAMLLIDLLIEPAQIEAWLGLGDRYKAELACEVIANGTGRPRGRYKHACHWSIRDRRRLLRLADRAIALGHADPRPYARTWLRRGRRNSSVLVILLGVFDRFARVVRSQRLLRQVPS